MSDDADVRAAAEPFWVDNRRRAEHAVNRAKGLDEASLIDSVAAAMDMAVADRDRLARELECEEADHRDQCAENARLAGEVERLRAALHPFAAMADPKVNGYKEFALARVTLCDAARAALAHDTARKDGE
jgi:hypothetical protein